MEDKNITRHSGMFKPGQSGNPLGRPKSDKTIRDLAKVYTKDALKTLSGIVKNPKASDASRIQAANSLLDRGLNPSPLSRQWGGVQDCDNDSLLDRHFGYPSYRGSGAWLTNHQSGKVEVNGKMRKWTYFIKIVAAPTDATATSGVWYAADSTEIGPVIWGQFAIIQQVSNGPSLGEHGVLYKSPSVPGFGQFGPE